MKRSPALLALCTLALACQKDAGLAPPNMASEAVHVGLRAQVTAPAGSTLDLRVVYFDKGASRNAAVVLADSQFTIDTGAQNLSLMVSVAECLKDNARVNPSSTACSLVVVGRLLTNGVITDSVILPPVPTTPGGTLKESTSISLSNLKTWVGGAAGAPADWSTAANWNPATVPVAGSVVTIPATSTTPALSANAAVAALTLTGAGANVTVNGHHLTVTGALVVTGGATFTMTNPADTVTIGGSATFTGGSEAGLLTAGVLSVGGGLDGLSPGFTVSGTMQVFATGPGVWNADTIPSLTVTGPGTTITTRDTVPPRRFTVGRLTLTNGASITTYNGIQPLLTVLSALSTAAGTTLSIDILTLHNPSALDSVNGSYTGVQTILDPRPIGAAVNISPRFTYQYVLVTNSAVATLTGPTTFAGPTENRLEIDLGASVNLNGQTVTMTAVQGSTTVLEAAIGSTIVSTNPNSVVSAPGGNVNLVSNETGLLTAGTWTVGSLTSNGLRTSGTFQLVLSGGAGIQSSTADSLASLTVTNNSVVDIHAQSIPSTLIKNLTVTNGATLGASTSTNVTLVGPSAFGVGTKVPSGTWRVATASPFTPLGTFSPASVYFVQPTTATTIPGGITPNALYVRGGAQASLGGNVTAGAVYVDSASSLNLNSHTLTAGATGVLTENGGTITMTSATDTLNAGGALTFSGGTESGLMTAGVLNAGAATLTSSGGTFVASGSLLTVCGSPTLGGALLVGTFQSLQVVNHCQAESSTLGGSLIAQPGATGSAPEIAASAVAAGPITAAGLNVTALIDSAVPLIANGVTAFQNVTFEGFTNAQTQLALTLAPGTTLTLTNVTFQALPTGSAGVYLNVSNSGGAGGAAVTINVSHDPGNGAAQTITSGNVTVNWSP